MNACFDDNIEATELVLRIILGRDDITVKSVKTQKLMKNLVGRDIWLDIDAVDGENREMDIEIQRSDRGAGFRRARYHSGILDAHLLKPGDSFDQLPETYVIFITEHDILGHDLPIYRIERTITELGLPFDDGSHVIYVNGEKRSEDTELSKLMRDFFCTDPDDMHFKPLAEKARYYKTSEEGVASMCRSIEEMRNQVAWEKTVEIAQRMLGTDLTFEQIAHYTGMTVEQVHEIAGQKSA